MEYKVLDRDASISLRGKKKTVEEIRETVARNERNIRIGTYYGKRRAGIYRNGIKVVVLEIEDKTLAPERIREELKQEILNGMFDEQLTILYGELLRERRKKKD
jgi:hypothetical protein